MAGLVEAFWDELYPLPDEDGIATRVAPVGGLNGEGVDGTLIQPLLKLPLFERPTGEGLPLWQYDQAARLLGEGDATRRQQRLDAGVLAFDQVETEARAAGGAHFARLRASAVAALDSWNGLSEALDLRAGAESPPTGRVRKVLEDIRDIAAKYAPAEEAGEAPAALAESVVEGAGGGPAAPPPGGSAAPGRIATREDALRALGEIAAFFRRTEPNSPLAYTLEEAVRRGRMAWPELLQEIVPDPSLRYAILTSLGIRPPSE
jgi:type VI secretion system protein ImpA